MTVGISYTASAQARREADEGPGLTEARVEGRQELDRGGIAQGERQDRA